MDRAKEWAGKRMDLYNAGGVLGFESWEGIELEMEKAFRAGHAQGIADANRIERRDEPNINFQRELGAG